MTSVKITGLNRGVKDLKKKILDSVERSGFDKRLAKDVAAEVRKNGIGPELESSTKTFRGKVVSKKGAGYVKDKSSLTLSGELLANLTGIFQRKAVGFFFGVKEGVHKPYRYKNKKGKVTKVGGKAQLIDIFDGLSKARPVTKVFENDDFRRGIERKLVAAIKRFFK